MNGVKRKIVSDYVFVTSRSFKQEKYVPALENKPQAVNRKWWLRAGLCHPHSKKNLTPLAAPVNPAALLSVKAHITFLQVVAIWHYRNIVYKVYKTAVKCFPMPAHLHIPNASEILLEILLFFKICIYSWRWGFCTEFTQHPASLMFLHGFVSPAPQLLLSMCTILHSSKHRHGQKVNTLQGRRKGFPKSYEPP